MVLDWSQLQPDLRLKARRSGGGLGKAYKHSLNTWYQVKDSPSELQQRREGLQSAAHAQFNGHLAVIVPCTIGGGKSQHLQLSTSLPMD